MLPYMVRYNKRKMLSSREQVSLKMPHSIQPVTNMWTEFLKDYCKISSLHGLRFVGESENWAERWLWLFFCAMAMAMVSYTCDQILTQFRTSPTITVIEDTNYEVSHIPFPAIAICDINKVYWDKAMEFEKQYMINESNETIDTFRKVISGMALLTFADFDYFSDMIGFNHSVVKNLENINMDDVMFKTAPTCGEMFPEPCWWRNNFYNCCDIFELQSTEDGFCYSFNSETSFSRVTSFPPYDWTNRNSIQVEKLNSQLLRPRRTVNFGQWGGLRFSVSTNPEQVSPLIKTNYTPGISVFVYDPYGFPYISSHVYAGYNAQISISAQVSYTTNRVRRLSPDRRKCLYDDESSALGLGTYRQQNCIIDCHLQHVIQYCNCTPYFYPSKDPSRSCNVTGYLCLAIHNDVFNYLKPATESVFFDNETPGMTCSCTTDCMKRDYEAEIYVSTHARCEKNKTLDRVFMDISYKKPAINRYRTDVVFGWLELTVSLGGLAGLFLGCSLLSGVELVYFFTVRLFMTWTAARRQCTSLHNIVPTRRPVKVLPIIKNPPKTELYWYM